MKVRTKILLLISSIALFFFILIYLFQITERKKNEELLLERKKENLESFSRTIESIGKTLEVFSTDYTQWTEMVDFVHHPDKTWALENIEYPLETFKTNAAWVFDENLNQVYEINNLNDSNLKKFPLQKFEIKDLIAKAYFNHFFIKVNDKLFEIRSAPIQPTDDVERKTKPQGYFFVARLWYSELIDEISSQTSSEIKLISLPTENFISLEDQYQIAVSKEVHDWSNKPIINIVSISDFTLLRKTTDIFNQQIILFFIFSLAILLSVGFVLLVYVNRPLRIIYNGLEQQNPALLVNVSKQRTEFGKLSDLIIQFYNQKEKLIDEEKQRLFAETSLTKSEEKYKKIFDNVQDVFFQTDLTGIIVSVSPSIERYSEYRQDEVIGKNIMDYYLDPAIRIKFLQDIQRKGEVTDFEIYFVKKTGRAIPCSVNAHFIYDDDKKIRGIEGSLRDISERKRNEELILKLSRVVEQSPVSIIITDIAGNIEYVNPKFIESSGYLIEEIIGKDVNILKSGLMPEVIYKDLWVTISSGKEWIGELQNRKKNGELFWENVFISPIVNPANWLITNYVAIKEDITDKKRIIEELRNAKERAEEMSNLKSSFLANMSHELRTPMMGILGNAEIINISTEDEEIKDMASAIYSSGRRLINTLNLILDLSRIEANKENLDVEKLEVVSIVNDVVEHFIPAAKQKGLDLRLINSNESLFAHLDERLFREILNNLINNAVKFTHVGGISVSLFNENEKIIIKVLDTGIGIPKHSLGLIFEEFRQVSEGYGRSFEGTGLGLTITKKFVEKLNGKISVKSVLDEGSEFTIEFPLVKE